jgi:hypothetical protein
VARRAFIYQVFWPMGRDYPVELELDTLCKNGFAQAKRAIARGSRTEVLIPAGSAIALLYSSDGQGFEPWVPVKEHTLSKRAQSTALPPILIG